MMTMYFVSTPILQTPDPRYTSTRFRRRFRYALDPTIFDSFGIDVMSQLEESKKTNAAIEGDRKMYLDAAIVRIMKANKTMTYEKIKTATIDAVKSHFAPQVELIKQRVDYLVEAEYLERDRAERNKFRYVA